MALEFEQLTAALMAMAMAAGRRSVMRTDRLAEAEAILRLRGGDLASIDRFVDYIRHTVLAAKRSFLGAAFPLDGDREPLAFRSGYPEERLAAEATIIAVDGSQIVPDRHGAYVYNLINVGAFVYHHGHDRPPEVLSVPRLSFPQPDELDSQRFGDGAGVTVERDIAEISRLGDLAHAYKKDGVPLLALLDQRLLYVPIGDLAPQFKEDTIRRWQVQMNEIRAAGGWLAGLIDRPGKAAVLRLLRALTPDFNHDLPDDLGTWEGLLDGELFAGLLDEGERSAVFVDLSPANHWFATHNANHEICFFYLNTGTASAPNIARVDLPRWVAEQSAAVETIHALLIDQCRILGRYPYALARADEVAVVSRNDQQELEFRMGRLMDEFGVASDQTAKQRSKEWVRSRKRRLE